ncbi:hypothetical protein [Streptomyces sp. NPDC004296]|uniref:hypothetical protein n=1 Tax=Streptomyces sp. NPDC004296 TaxID=3364697 RepID=UPI00367F3609
MHILVSGAVPQLAQVIGVAGCGSVFLARTAEPGGRAAASAHALYATALPVAVGSLLAALAVLPLLRRR